VIPDENAPGARRELRVSLVQIALIGAVALTAAAAWILLAPGEGSPGAAGRQRSVTERSEQDVSGKPSVFDDAPPEEPSPPRKANSTPKATGN